MLLLLERLNLGGRVVLFDAALATETLDVGQLVDGHGVLLVQRGAVQGLDGGLSLCGGLVLNKGVALGHVVLFADGHEDKVLAGLAGSGELAEDELDQLSLALLGDLGKAVDDYERVEALLHAHVELLAQICRAAVSIAVFNLSRCCIAGRARPYVALSCGVAYRSSRFRHRRSSRRCRDYQSWEPCWRLCIKWWSWLPLFDFDVQKSAGAGGVTCVVLQRPLPSSKEQTKDMALSQILFPQRLRTNIMSKTSLLELVLF